MRIFRSTRNRWRLGLAAAAALAAVLPGIPAVAASPEGQVLNAGGATAVTDSYIVVFKDTAMTPAGAADKARGLAVQHGGAVTRTYHYALHGFEARLSASAAKQLAADPSVRYVEQNHTVKVANAQNSPPSWGLDRIDQRDLPLNNSYTYYRTSGNSKMAGECGFGGDAIGPGRCFDKVGSVPISCFGGNGEI
jgi:hypothetical protein